MKKILLLLMMIFATAACVIAVQPTQQYYKAYMSPFYVSSMSNGVNQTFNLTVNPPDGVGQVTAAIVNFNAQINGQTQTFTLWVNGQSCNNPTYTIATAFSTTGNIQFSFDCSNRITRAGTYTITLLSAVNTGAISGWLDLAYINNPIRDMNVYGTEYTTGQNGTIFINLITNQNLASSLCYIDIFYPNKTYYYSGPLTQLQSNLALFYYDFTVPTIQGVYMAASTCVQPLVTTNQTRYFNRQSTIYANYSNQTLVNFTNVTQQTYAFGSLTTRTCSEPDWIDTQAQVFRLNSITNLSIWLASGASRASTIEVNFYRYNRNTLQRGDIGHSSLSATVTTTITRFALPNVTEYADFTAADALLAEICLTNAGGATPYTFYFGNATTPSGFLMNVNSIDNTSTQTIEYHGGGEIHVNPSTSTSGSIAGDVWTYTNRTLTATAVNYSAVSDAVWNATTRTLTSTAVNYSAVATAVWNATTRNLTYYQNFSTPQIDMTNYTLISQQVWGYFNRTLSTEFENYTPEAAAIWSYVDRNLTYYPAQADMTNYSLIGIYVWNETTRNLTYYQNFSTPQQDLTNYNLISVYVWNATERNLTYYAPATVDTNAVATAVWNFTTRNLTYYPPQIDMTNYTLITNSVWEYTGSISANILNLLSTGIWTYTTRNLTYYENFTIPQQDLTNYSRISNLTASDVWTYANRNLTYYPTQLDLTNYSRISNLTAQDVWTYITRNLTYYAPATVDDNAVAQAVWNYTTRNLTFYPAQTDMTNYDLIGVYVWNATTRNLTYYPAQTDMTNYSRISNLTANEVWTYTTRDLTYYQNFSTPQVDMTNYTLINEGVSAAVWVYTTRNLTYYAPAIVDTNAVAVAVWNATTRNLTYYPAQVDMTNYSLIESGVWAYVNRTLTYYPAQQDLTNYSAIESGVWAYSNRNLTFYPTQQDLTNYTLINEGVWTYTNRNLTYYPAQTDMTNYTGIAASVWNYTTRDLTYYQINNITASDVWNYINRTLSYYQVNNITTTDIWTYNNRTLTYYPSQQDLTNYTAIWTYPDRNLTYYAPATVNSTAIAGETWNYGARYVHGIILN